jgi:hypothetical protein
MNHDPRTCSVCRRSSSVLMLCACILGMLGLVAAVLAVR